MTTIIRRALAIASVTALASFGTLVGQAEAATGPAPALFRWPTTAMKANDVTPEKFRICGDIDLSKAAEQNAKAAQVADKPTTKPTPAPTSAKPTATSAKPTATSAKPTATATSAKPTGTTTSKPTGTASALKGNLATAEAMKGNQQNFKAAPASFSLRKYALPAGNQGQVGSCVAWATGYSAYGILMNQQNIKDGPMAPMYIYSQVSRGGDNGTTAGVVLPMLKEQGITTQSDWGQGKTTNWQTMPTQAQRDKAKNYKLTGFENLMQGGDRKQAVKDAISKGYPVAIGATITSQLQQLGRGQVYSGGGSALGGHEMAIVGYDENTVEIQNSWGTGWGDSGFFKASWSWLASSAVMELNSMKGVAGKNPTPGPGDNKPTGTSKPTSAAPTNNPSPDEDGGPGAAPGGNCPGGNCPGGGGYYPGGGGGGSCPGGNCPGGGSCPGGNCPGGGSCPGGNCPGGGSCPGGNCPGGGGGSCPGGNCPGGGSCPGGNCPGGGGYYPGGGGGGSCPGGNCPGGGSCPGGNCPGGGCDGGGCDGGSCPGGNCPGGGGYDGGGYYPGGGGCDGGSCPGY